MKNFYYIGLFLALLISGCSEDVWLDHNDPRIYIPKNGFSVNKAWAVDSQEYIIELSAYCAGVRPDNQQDEITVEYTVEPKLITDYNQDISQQYAGLISQLPSDCYSFLSDKIVIPQGKSHGEIGIRINLKKMKELGLKLNEVKYAIPVMLKTTSKYNLQDNVSMLSAIYCVTLDEPGFYFWDNRGETSDMKEIGKKVLYGAANDVSEYRIVSNGLTAGEAYTLELGIDEKALPKGGKLLPENAYEVPKTITIPSTATDAYLPVKIINDQVTFGAVYYLPVAIVSANKYGPAPKKATLLVKVEVKNDYEWSYKSLISIQCESTQRSGNYSVTKAPVSINKDIIRIQMITNNTIAGITSGTNTSSTAFNNKYYQLKIVPTDNKNKYKLEIIKEGTSVTPATLEFDPDKESYYDWNYEKFYLYYRFKDSSGKWVNVSEILEAQ